MDVESFVRKCAEKFGSKEVMDWRDIVLEGGDFELPEEDMDLQLGEDESWERVNRAVNEWVNRELRNNSPPVMVKFMQVGRNATHNFYLGWENGNLYKASVGVGFKDPEWHLVNQGNVGYCGHF